MSKKCHWPDNMKFGPGCPPRQWEVQEGECQQIQAYDMPDGAEVVIYRVENACGKDYRSPAMSACGGVMRLTSEKPSAFILSAGTYTLDVTGADNCMAVFCSPSKGGVAFLPCPPEEVDFSPIEARLDAIEAELPDDDTFPVGPIVIDATTGTGALTLNNGDTLPISLVNIPADVFAADGAVVDIAAGIFTLPLNDGSTVTGAVIAPADIDFASTTVSGNVITYLDANGAVITTTTLPADADTFLVAQSLQPDGCTLRSTLSDGTILETSLCDLVSNITETTNAEGERVLTHQPSGVSWVERSPHPAYTLGCANAHLELRKNGVAVDAVRYDRRNVLVVSATPAGSVPTANEEASPPRCWTVPAEADGQRVKITNYMSLGLSGEGATWLRPQYSTDGGATWSPISTNGVDVVVVDGSAEHQFVDEITITAFAGQVICVRDVYGQSAPNATIFSPYRQDTHFEYITCSEV